MAIRHQLFKFWNFYPPFVGAGIQIQEVSPDFSRIKVILKKRFWTSNYVGTQFGGSIYMMTDPFLMVMLLKKLGTGYIIWDKAANLHFRKPGRTELTVEFTLSDETLEALRKKIEEQTKYDWLTTIQVKDNSGEVVAEVEKTIYLRKKDSSRS